MKAFTSDLIDELEILALYNLSNHQEGLKVHNNASFKAQGAITRLYEKGLISQSDGGYLTSLGIGAAEHAQTVLLMHVLHTDRDTLVHTMSAKERSTRLKTAIPTRSRTRVNTEV